MVYNRSLKKGKWIYKRGKTCIDDNHIPRAKEGEPLLLCADKRQKHYCTRFNIPLRLALLVILKNGYFHPRPSIPTEFALIRNEGPVTSISKIPSTPQSPPSSRILLKNVSLHDIILPTLLMICLPKYKMNKLKRNICFIAMFPGRK